MDRGSRTPGPYQRVSDLASKQVQELRFTPVAVWAQQEPFVCFIVNLIARNHIFGRDWPVGDDAAFARRESRTAVADAAIESLEQVGTSVPRFKTLIQRAATLTREIVGEFQRVTLAVA
jgi:hypothetical protein